MTSPTGPSILEQLNQGWRVKGWTVGKLVEELAKAGLEFDRTTVAKKMKGQIPLKDLEIQAFATLFEVTITWPAPSPVESANEEPAAVEGAA